MCILIHHPVNTKFAAEQLQDFYNKNPDGFGAIVKRGGTVEVIKSIGKIDEVIDLYNKEVSGHEAIIHFRMKTHGDINIANCHPYEVVPGLWMAHNGILSTGNAANPAMSDTWHYIQNFLKPLLERDPDLIKQEAFQRLIASHIGNNNKFGLMNQDGECFIINRNSGVDHQGVWYSNTYAWTTWKFGYGQKPASYGNGYATAYNRGSRQQDMWDSRYASSSTWKYWDEIDRLESGKAPAKPVKSKARAESKKKLAKADLDRIKNVSTEALVRIIRHSYNAVQMKGFQGAIEWVSKHPLAAMRFIYEIYGSEHNSTFNAKGIHEMVTKDVGDAADLICEIWEEMEIDLCQVAGIQQTQGVYAS